MPDPYPCLIVFGAADFDDVLRAYSTPFIADASHIVGIKHGRALVLKDRDGTLTSILDGAEVLVADVRSTESQYREDGLRLQVALGDHPAEDQVRTVEGVPIRGVTKVTIEDDPETGRVVHLRMRDVALVPLVSDDPTTNKGVDQ
jgi:hypothetical protein